MVQLLNVKSTEYSNATATPIVLAQPSLASAKIRIQPVTWAIGGAADVGSTALLARMPAGQVTIWTALSKLYNSAWAASSTAAFGYGAYYTPTANPPLLVAASAAALKAAASMSSAGSFNLDSVDLAGFQTFLSLTGFDITLVTAGAALGGTETIKGVIAYTVD